MHGSASASDVAQFRLVPTAFSDAVAPAYSVLHKGMVLWAANATVHLTGSPFSHVGFAGRWLDCQFKRRGRSRSRFEWLRPLSRSL